MSRIRGIEVKVQKEVLQTRKYGLNEILRKKNEDHSANSKDDAEKHQIKDLLLKLPGLNKIFDVHRKIGEGTFSSVYLGSLRQHATLPDSEKRWFAIKHLVPTAHPARIEHELRCLRDMGGKDHVIGVELCLRNLDTIVFIMPYIPHKKFSEYVGEMDAEELRDYMRALLVALRHVHSFGVIHRDVKPSNFLYDRDNRRYLSAEYESHKSIRMTSPSRKSNKRQKRPTVEKRRSRNQSQALTRSGIRKIEFYILATSWRCSDTIQMDVYGVDTEWYLLVDFGLAQRLCPAPEEPAPDRGPALAHSNGVRKRAREEEEAESNAKRRRSAAGPVAGGGAGGGAGACACAGAAGVCAACGARPAPRAPRAGTQGFRPPEVLLKYAQQTTAVDVWAGGVVLASALTARYPFFRAGDDVAALAELADLLGTASLQRAAEALGRRVVTSLNRRGLCLRKLAVRLRGGATGGAGAGEGAGEGACEPCACCRLPQDQCLCRDETKKAEDFVPGLSVAGFPDAAFALAARLLDPDPRTRISAAAALRHPFLAPADSC